MNKVIGPGFEDVLDKETKRGASMDFATVARTADDCARHMAMGYGEHANADIPGFTQFAKDAEAWFRAIHGAALAEDTIALQGLMTNATDTHCDRCHDAAADH